MNTGGTTVPAATSFSNIFEPAAIAFDAGGRLFVTESATGTRGRVLVWFPPFSPASIGAPATRILGVDQSTPPPPTISQYQFQQQPSGLFAVGNQIGVADTFNNRLLLFPPVEQWNANLYFQGALTVIGQTSFSTGAVNQSSAFGRPVHTLAPGWSFRFQLFFVCGRFR